MPAPGEPLFLEEDTALVIALAEEERDTCSSCGMPKAFCRDPRAQFTAFAVHEETCFATYKLAEHRKGVDEKRSDETRASTQMSVRFADGYNVDLDAGLDLAVQEHDDTEQPEERQDG
jgi:hypothetical protein